MYLFSYFRDQELHEYHSYLEIFTQVQIIMFSMSHFAVNIYPANTVLEVQIVNCHMPPGRGPGGTGGLLAGLIRGRDELNTNLCDVSKHSLATHNTPRTPRALIGRHGRGPAR